MKIDNLEAYIRWCAREYTHECGDHYEDMLQEGREAYYRAVEEGLSAVQVANRVKNSMYRYKLRMFGPVKYNTRSKFKGLGLSPDDRRLAGQGLMYSNPMHLIDLLDNLETYEILSELDVDITAKRQEDTLLVMELKREGLKIPEIMEKTGFNRSKVNRLLALLRGKYLP